MVTENLTMPVIATSTPFPKVDFKKENVTISTGVTMNADCALFTAVIS
jgi:hypothetical protein